MRKRKARSARRRGAALLAGLLVVGPGACHRAPEAAIAPDPTRVDAYAIETALVQNEDVACLRGLESRGVTYKRVPPAGGMHTPVEVAGPIGRVALVARGRRAAVMDCVLARALDQAGGIFEELGITGLAFSAAFDHRTRRGTNEASAHAYGLAIDVHEIRGSFGEYDVLKHFERGVGLWRGLRKDPSALDACVGHPATKEGRVLRQLACRLKLHPAFRVIVTPDDDADHQDHLHLEAGATFFPPSSAAPPLAPPATPPPAPPAKTPPEAKSASAPRSITKRKSLSKRKPPPKAKKTKAKAKAKTLKKRPSQKAKPAIEKKSSWTKNQLGGGLSTAQTIAN